jgi:hypothetical protein
VVGSPIIAEHFSPRPKHFQGALEQANAFLVAVYHLGAPEAPLKISIANQDPIRLEDLLEYDDINHGSYIQKPTASAAATSTSTPPTATDDASDDSAITLEDILKGILEEPREQRSQEEQAAFNAALQNRLREQEREEDESFY